MDNLSEPSSESSSERKCTLCRRPAETLRPWDEDWDRKCAQSIRKLLNIENTPFSSLFDNLICCPPCHWFVHEIDFTMRTLTSLTRKSLKFRSMLSRMLISNFEVNCPPQTSNIPGRQGPSSTNGGTSQNTEIELIDLEYANPDSEDLSDPGPKKISISPAIKTDVEIDIIEEDDLYNPTIITLSDATINENTIAGQQQIDPATQIARPLQILTVLDLKDEPLTTQLLLSDASDNASIPIVPRRSGRRVQKIPNYRVDQIAQAQQESEYSTDEFELEEESAENKNKRRKYELEDKTPEEREAEKALARYQEQQRFAQFNPRVDKLICGIDGCTFRTMTEDWMYVHQVEHRIATKPNPDGRNDPFFCPVYNLHFATLEIWTSHMKRLHRPTLLLKPLFIQCPMCSKKFGTTKVRRREFKSFKYHFEAIHAPRDPETDTRRFKFLCPVRDCPSRCLTQKHLDIHNRKCHQNDPKPYKCDICSRGFKTDFSVVLHKRIAHIGPVAICHICGAGFPTKQRISAHIKIHHPDAEAYHCKICTAIFFFTEDCQAHERLHKRNSFICVLGECYFNRVQVPPMDHGSLEALRQHIQDVHKTEKRFKCDSCDYTCKFKHNLEVHQLRHSMEKPFQCKSCPKRFKSKQQLNIHEENKHPDLNNIKVYKCKLCPETFHSSQAISRHTFWHKHGSNVPPIPRKRLNSQSASRKRNSVKQKRKKIDWQYESDSEDSNSDSEFQIQANEPNTSNRIYMTRNRHSVRDT